MLAALERLGLLKAGERVEEPLNLARLCDQGALVGGLSVALDVRPDELFGGLATRVGGAAAALKILDVRDRPTPSMVVQSAGKEIVWKVPDVAALIRQVNALVAADATAKLTAVLGEWEESLALWCLDRAALRELVKEREFNPQNLAQLKKLAAARAHSSRA